MEHLLNDRHLKQRGSAAMQYRRLLDADHDHRQQLSGGAAADGNDRSTDDANFDTNMVIILAVLLCALVVALGLNSIVRCALRCGRGTRRPPVDAPGLKKRELRQIPVAVYDGAAAESCGRQPAVTECSICLAEFADGERVRVLPKCNHAFHVGCIDTWLLSHSSCPNCRHSLVIDRPGPEHQPPPLINPNVNDHSLLN